ERALELGYREEDVFIWLHWTHRQLGDLDATLAAVNRGLEAFPGSAWLFRLRAGVRLEMKDEAGAAAGNARAGAHPAPTCRTARGSPDRPPARARVTPAFERATPAACGPSAPRATAGTAPSSCRRIRSSPPGARACRGGSARAPCPWRIARPASPPP